MVDDKDDYDNGEMKMTTKLTVVPTPPPTTIEPIVVILNDTSGNLVVDNPLAPAHDPNLSPVKYTRTPNQDMSLRLHPSEETLRGGIIEENKTVHKNVMNFPRVGGGGLKIEEGVGW